MTHWRGVHSTGTSPTLHHLQVRITLDARSPVSEGSLTLCNGRSFRGVTSDCSKALLKSPPPVSSAPELTSAHKYTTARTDWRPPKAYPKSLQPASSATGLVLQVYCWSRHQMPTECRWTTLYGETIGKLLSFNRSPKPILFSLSCVC